MRVLVASVLSLAFLADQSPERDLYDVEVSRVTDTIYVAQRPEPLRPYVEGNVTIVINAHDVVLVDAGGAPSSARQVIAEIRRLTPNPVRYIITTHIHRDHRFGVQEYLREFPGAEVIAHPEVIRVVAGSGDAFVTRTAARLAADTAAGRDEVARLEREGSPPALIRHLRRYYERDLPRLLREYQGIRNIAPGMAVGDRLTLHRGTRTIDVRFLGRGDTPEDLIVHLPQDRIVVAGDMVVHPFPYGFSDQPEEWMSTMRRLLDLDFELLVPGHGDIQRGKTYVRSVIALVQAVHDEVRRARRDGRSVTPRELLSLATPFVGDDPVGRYYFERWFLEPAIARVPAVSP